MSAGWLSLGASRRAIDALHRMDSLCARLDRDGGKQRHPYDGCRMFSSIERGRYVLDGAMTDTEIKGAATYSNGRDYRKLVPPMVRRIYCRPRLRRRRQRQTKPTQHLGLGRF